MAITVAEVVNIRPASAGDYGHSIVRLILDGSATSYAITLPSTHTIKTIRAATGGSSNNITAKTGVAATTGFTVKFAAGTNTEHLDVSVYGTGA